LMAVATDIVLAQLASARQAEQGRGAHGQDRPARKQRGGMVRASIEGHRL
jgi:hypothetical protein